jgi:transcriptional regulator with XRE-family HTH domain
MAMRNDGTKPSSLAAAWGMQLKLYREAAGLTQEQLAARVGYSRSTIANLEAGNFAPGTDVAAALDPAVGADGRLVRLRDDLIAIEVVGPWYRDWLQIQEHATALRGSAVVLVPGLLQTPAYARAVFEGNEDAVAARLAEQAILTKEDPPTIRFVLDQQLLERPIGGAEVMAEQLAHLEDMVTSGRANILICPSGAVPGASSSFVLATVDGTSLGYLEAATKGFVLSKREDVLALEAWYEKVLTEALPTSASLETLRRMKDTWKT